MLRNSIVRSKGFTLVELMVVLVIVSVISAAIVPSFSSTLQKNRQREAGMMIVQGVWTARSRAVRTNRCHMVRVFQDGEVSVNGGAVGIYEARWIQGLQFNCSHAIRTGLWDQISFKALDTSKDPGGAGQAGLVGKDVVFRRVLAPPEGLNPVCNTQFGLPDPGILYFEPTGIPYQPYERYFEVVIMDAAGKPKEQSIMYTRFGSDGSAGYQICE